MAIFGASASNVACNIQHSTVVNQMYYGLSYCSAPLKMTHMTKAISNICFKGDNKESS